VYNQSTNKKQVLKSATLIEVVSVVWHGNPLQAKTYKSIAKKNLGSAGASITRRTVEAYVDKQGDRLDHDSFLRVYRSIADEPEATHRKRHQEEPDKAFEDDLRVWNRMCRNAGEDAPDVKPRWLAFENFRNAVRRDQPEIPLSTFLDFLYAQADREFDDVHLLVWMFAAYLEFHCVDRGSAIGLHKDSFVGKFVPANIWMPEANEKGQLCTSRYKVLDYIAHVTKQDLSERSIQHLRGERQWRTRAQGCGVRELNVPKALSILVGERPTDRYDPQLIGVLQFARIFEWLQLVQLCISDKSAQEIVRSFSRFPSLYEQFHTELQHYNQSRPR